MNEEKNEVKSEAKFTVHRCPVCGQILIIEGDNHMVQKCCGHEMIILQANTEDASTEKHVPVIERTKTGVKVRVGEIAHPMEEEHHIEMVAIIADGIIARQFMRPDTLPEAEFEIDASSITAIAYCNLHGLWQASIE